MLQVVSGNEFNSNWTSIFDDITTDDGYILLTESGGGMTTYAVSSVIQLDSCNYYVEIIVTLYYGTEENYNIAVTSCNGDCSINSIEIAE